MQSPRFFVVAVFVYLGAKRRHSFEVSEVFATRIQLARYGANASVLQAIPLATQDAALEAASCLAREYLASVAGVSDGQITGWPESVAEAVCKIAAYNLLSIRGFNPGAGSDVNYRLRSEDAMSYLRGVARQEIHPALTLAPGSSVANGQGPRVISTGTGRAR